MKYIYIIGILLLTVVLGCQEDDFEFGDIVTPTNLQVDISIADDNSGNVTLIPTADNAINFHVIFTLFYGKYLVYYICILKSAQKY